MDDAQIRAAFEHAQKQINFLADATGQLLGAIVLPDPMLRDGLDKTMTALAALAAGDRSRAAIMERLQAAAEKMVAAGLAALPDSPEDQAGGGPA